MNVIEARIMDETHLELTQPISSRPGEIILISIINDNNLWQEKGKKLFLEAYDDRDSIYDNL